MDHICKTLIGVVPLCSNVLVLFAYHHFTPWQDRSQRLTEIAVASFFMMKSVYTPQECLQHD